MAKMLKSHTIKCPNPNCNTEAVVQVWSCGCQIVNGPMHCGTKNFAGYENKCGEAGAPKSHRNGPPRPQGAVVHGA